MSNETQRRTIVDAAHWRSATPSERESLAVSKFVSTPATDLITKGVTLLNPDGSAGESVERGVWFTVSTEVRDRDRDRIAVEGWDLHNFLANPVVPWCHNYSAPPVGKARQVIVDRKTRRLRMLKEFAPREVYDFADTIYQLTVHGYINTCSVGFIPKEYGDDEPQPGEDPNRPVGYYIARQELLESSPVTVPSNPTALVEARSLHHVNLDPLYTWAEQLLAEHPQRGLWIPKKTLEQVVSIAGPQRSFHLVTGLNESPTPSTQTAEVKAVGSGSAPARCSIIEIPADVETRSVDAPAQVAPVPASEPATQVAPVASDVPAQPSVEPVTTPAPEAEPVVATPAPEAPETRTVAAFTDAEIETEIVETKATTFKPPKVVASAAQHGLNLREKFNRGGTAVGVARANQLAARKPVSEATVYRMVSYFARHAVDRQAEGWGDESAPSAGYIAWLLWGGDPGRDWANGIKERLDAAEERSMSTNVTATESTTVTAKDGSTPNTIDAPRSEPAAPSVVVPAAPSGAVEPSASTEAKAAEPASTKAADAEEEIVPAEIFAKGLALIREAADEFFKLTLAKYTANDAERIRAASAVQELEGALELLGIDDEDALEEDELYETEGRSAKRRGRKSKAPVTAPVAQTETAPAQVTVPAPTTNPGDATKGVAPATTNTTTTSHSAAGEQSTTDIRAALAGYVATLDLTRGTAN